MGRRSGLMLGRCAFAIGCYIVLKSHERRQVEHINLFGHVGWVHHFALHGAPVDTLEKFMLHNVANIWPHALVRYENALDEIPRNRSQVFRQNKPSCVG